MPVAAIQQYQRCMRREQGEKRKVCLEGLKEQASE